MATVVSKVNGMGFGTRNGEGGSENGGSNESVSEHWGQINEQ
jgi:hypothetical protein